MAREMEGVQVPSAVGRFLTRKTADPEIALDLWAETFAKAFMKRDDLRGDTDAEAGGWLWSIARNELAAYYRHGAVETEAIRRLAFERPVAGDDVLADLSEQAALEELRVSVEAALDGISASSRAAVQLRVVEELEYRDIADRLGVSEGAARVRVSRGLSELASVLESSTQAGV